jgi:hypothetical protein
MSVAYSILLSNHIDQLHLELKPVWGEIKPRRSMKQASLDIKKKDNTRDLVNTDFMTEYIYCASAITAFSWSKTADTKKEERNRKTVLVSQSNAQQTKSQAASTPSRAAQHQPCQF